jgi:hypothetical protein
MMTPGMRIRRFKKPDTIFGVQELNKSGTASPNPLVPLVKRESQGWGLYGDLGVRL